MTAKLEPFEVKLYYKLYFGLLSFVNKKYNVVQNDQIKSYEQLQKIGTMEEKGKIREVLYKRINSIDDFVIENPEKFNKAELDIIISWKHFLKGKFYLAAYLREYAIFLTTGKVEKVYGVKALMNDFDEVIHYDPPILLEATLLPFKKHIIYDGYLSPYPVHFGSGIRRDLERAYNEAKARFGVITSLPEPVETQKPNNKELLKFYLKNDNNQEYYSEEIENLLKKHPSLIDVYYQELGKSDARKFIRRLHEVGIKKTWYATLQGIIVTSGTSKEEIAKNVDKIVPTNKIKQVYIFQVK